MALSIRWVEDWESRSKTKQGTDDNGVDSGIGEMGSEVVAHRC